LFDLLMRRIDYLQTHRSGVLALLRAMPSAPPMALLLACATRRSMRWMLEAAGVAALGPCGELRVRGLIAVWLWTLRAWERDTSEDLSGTMAALDAALRRAGDVVAWLRRPSRPGAAEPGSSEPGLSDPDAAEPSRDAPTRAETSEAAETSASGGDMPETDAERARPLPNAEPRSRPGRPLP